MDLELLFEDLLDDRDVEFSNLDATPLPPRADGPGAGRTGHVEDGAAGLGWIDLGGGEPAGLPAEATGYGEADLQ